MNNPKKHVFNLKLTNVKNKKIFPRVTLHGFSENTYYLMKKTDFNDDNIKNRISTIKSIRENEDELSLQNAFIFAESFNDVGFEVEEDPIISNLIKSISNDNKNNYVKAFSMKDIKSIYSAMPNIVVRNLAGKIASKMTENVSTWPISDAMNKMPNVNNNTYLFFASAVKYGFFGELLLSRNEFLDVFRDSIGKSQFAYFSPLIELYGKNYFKETYTEKSRNIYLKPDLGELYIFPLFIAINEFLEHGEEDQYLVDYLLENKYSNSSASDPEEFILDDISNADTNAYTVGEQYHSFSINRYEHTSDLMNAFVLPGRIFNLSFISDSGVRKTISESKKSVLKNLVSLNFPIGDASNDKYGYDSNKEFDIIASSLNDLSTYGLNNKKNKFAKAITDDIIPRSSNREYKKEDIENFVERTSRVNNKDVLKTMQSSFNHIPKSVSNFVVNEFMNPTFDSKSNISITADELLVFMYAIEHPLSVGAHSKTSVLQMLYYAMNVKNVPSSYIAETLLYLITSFEGTLVSSSDWVTIFDTNVEDFNPIQLLNIVLSGGGNFKKNKNHNNPKIFFIEQNFREHKEIEKVRDGGLSNMLSALEDMGINSNVIEVKNTTDNEVIENDINKDDSYDDDFGGYQYEDDENLKDEIENAIQNILGNLDSLEEKKIKDSIEEERRKTRNNNHKETSAQNKPVKKLKNNTHTKKKKNSSNDHGYKFE